MECLRCRGKYDEELRRPKLLPCGHVFCRPCLQPADRCFSDDKAFSKTVDDLPDDLYTLGLLRIPPTESEDAPDSAGVLSLWCQTCAAAASEACLDSQDAADPRAPRAHALRSMTRHRHEVLLDRLEAMRAVLEKPTADRQDNEVMTQLASSGEVELSLDGLSATVQLGGSCAEDSAEAWAVQQLLLNLTEDVVQKPVPEPPAKGKDGLRLGFGLFGEDLALFGDDEDDDDESKSAMLALVDQDAEEDPQEDAEEDAAELDLSPTADPHLDSRDLSKVRRIVNLSCKKDPQRTLALLQAVAPRLEELQLRHADRAHLAATLRMPRLWRLEAAGADSGDPFVVPAVLPHDGGLRVLQVSSLSASTVASLALAHQRTLEHVLVVVPPPRGPKNWLFGDLDYRGGGRVAMPRFKRDPFFPPREPGQFPVLKSIEFEPSSPAMAALQDMYPGVHVGSPKSIVGWGAAIKARLKER